MDPIDTALAYFERGYACSQSILLAFGPTLGLPADLAAKIAGPFGGGISRLGETCGAVSGAAMVLGLRFAVPTAPDPETKDRIYRRTQEFFARFREEYGTTLCRELLGCNMTDPAAVAAARERGVFKQCKDYVRSSALLLTQALEAG